MKLYVLAEHRGWSAEADYDEHYCEAGVLLITESLPQAERLAQARIDAPFDDDPPPSTWFLDLHEMEIGVPLSGKEPRIVVKGSGGISRVDRKRLFEGSRVHQRQDSEIKAHEPRVTPAR